MRKTKLFRHACADAVSLNNGVRKNRSLEIRDAQSLVLKQGKIHL